MMRRVSLLFVLLALPACGGLELESDFAEDVLVPQYAVVALQVHSPFALAIGTVSALDQPALDRFGYLVGRELRKRELRVIDEVETASSHLAVDLIVEHSRDRGRGGPGRGNEVWYTYVLSWRLNSIERPLWVGSIRARARYGGGDLEQGVGELLELLFNGEERQRASSD